VHPVQECVELAQRRRAFARALRVSGQIDPAAVIEYVSHASPAESGGARPASGTPQEMKS
jgi:predicted RNA-binding protein YlxR (DUF448 family)